MVLIDILLTPQLWTLLVLTTVITLYYFMKRRYNYFKSLGIPYQIPVPILGNFGRYVFGTATLKDCLRDLYKNFEDKPYFGTFEFFNPLLIIKDPELIKQITVKDFESFQNHRQTIPADDPYFGKFLFILRGNKWKHLRNTLTPAFTANKMKHMFNLMNDCGSRLNTYIEELIKENNLKKKKQEPYPLELRDIITKFTNDVIASTAFGVSCNSLKNPENEFYLMGKNTATFTAFRSMLLFMFGCFPNVMKMTGLKAFPLKLANFFENIVKETINQRKEYGIVRPDMIHLLMQIRKESMLNENNTNKDVKFGLDDEEIAAQVILFFIAGFDTLANLIVILVSELLMNPDIQERLQNEIDTIKREHDGKIDYDILQKMTYLDMVVSETLRKYPISIAIDRTVSKPYYVEANDSSPAFTIPKEQDIWIPIEAIQNDPKYFPNPEIFDPERFSPENKSKIVPYTYLPFGIGPRMCIGNRFALMETKIAIVCLLSHFNIVRVNKTIKNLEFAKHTFILQPSQKWWVGFELRNK